MIPREFDATHLACVINKTMSSRLARKEGVEEEEGWTGFQRKERETVACE